MKTQIVSSGIICKIITAISKCVFYTFYGRLNYYMLLVLFIGFGVVWLGFRDFAFKEILFCTLSL